MIKFVSILLPVIGFNYATLFSPSSDTSAQELDVEFSNDAVAIESGQPVFTMGTKVWITNPKKENIKLFLNEKEKEINAEVIDLSKITNLDEGTYTLVVNTTSAEKVFGFTIQ